MKHARIQLFPTPRTERQRTRFRALVCGAGGVLAGIALAGTTHAQVNFSVDWRSMTIATPDTFTGTPITEGDILSPPTGGGPAFGPLPPPGIVQTGGFGAPAPGLALGAHALCVGHPPGTPCRVEVDALSYGVDNLVSQGAAGNINQDWLFSVDRFAMGAPGAPLFPNVTSESPCLDHSADVFRDTGLPPGPLCPALPAFGGNTGIMDGDGLPSCTGAVYPGLGLFELGLIGIISDNLDALDVGTDRKPKATYFSLDASFVDPFTGVPNSGSALAHGFVGGDVLVTFPGAAAPIVYAPAASLGLDVGGIDIDDLDALVLVENGLAGYQPSVAPYDWLFAGTDMLMFSVRRGSAVIGAIDSICGMPIVEGDILVPPTAAGGAPGIWIGAEHLGLTTTRFFPVLSDDLNALDNRQNPSTGSRFCPGDGSGTPCPCGNNSLPGSREGCLHSGGTGALLCATGTPRVSADTVTLYVTGAPALAPILYFQGTAQVAGGNGAAFGDGLRCVGGSVIRLGVKFSVNGSSCFGFGVPGDPKVSVKGAVPAVGGLRHYQAWYRNNAVFCTPSTFNLTNGYSINWLP